MKKFRKERCKFTQDALPSENLEYALGSFCSGLIIGFGVFETYHGSKAEHGSLARRRDHER